MTARGELLLGEDRPSEASPVLGQSWRLWQATELPYESARARLRYAEALAADGDAAAARRDLLAARGVLERLGATLDVQRIDALLGREPGWGCPGRLCRHATSAGRVRRTFMFTDIVTSTDLVGLIGDDAWNDLLGWHDRELRSAFAAHRGEEVDHTGDGFFVAFHGPPMALNVPWTSSGASSAIGGSTDSRPGSGSGCTPPRPRARGRNYSGGGVHVAARVGAAAGKDEILVSTDVVREAGRDQVQAVRAASRHPEGRPGARRRPDRRVAVGAGPLSRLASAPPRERPSRSCRFVTP